MTTVPMRWRVIALAVAVGLPGCDRAAAPPRGAAPPGRAAPPSADAIGQALEAAVRSGPSLQGLRATETERAELRRLYEASGNAPLWLTGSGEPRQVATEAIGRLLDAEADGLRPADYGAPRLDALARQMLERPDARSAAELDQGLSLAALRYLRHLHAGRVDPRTIGLGLDPAPDHHDYPALLSGAIQEGTLAEVVDELLPPLGQYRLVREALATYRRGAPDSTSFQTLALPVPLKRGATAPGLDALAERLVLLGDLTDSVPPRDSMPSGDSTAAADSAAMLRYEGALLGAVARFQARHGLPADSVLGRKTLDALNVPPAWRVHQLELALERLRWIGHIPNAPFLLVNIPMFELTAWTSPADRGPPPFRVEVIVGKALDHETPVFVEEMRYLVFRPYWNIPSGILKEEVVPAMKRDEGYLRKNDMEIVAGQGDDARVVEQSDETVDQLVRGRLRVRQRPGPRNSLGLIKFAFPNNQNIYLHDTPAGELFDRTRRDFSHGCVRVKDPVALAEWVLADQTAWRRERIVEAMNDRSRDSRRVNLSRPLSVVLFYTTAWVDPDGRARFAPDIYGHDRRIDRALHGHSLAAD